MLPKDSDETLQTERISGARRVGLWKVLAISLLVVVLGFGGIAALTAR